MGLRITRTNEIADEKDTQIGIYLALEWNHQEIADAVGFQASAISKRLRAPGHAEAIEKAKSWASAASARYLAKKIRDIETKADIKARIHEKSYKLVERTVDDGLSAAEVGPVHLKAADMGIERVEGKALDRKTIESMHTEVRRVEISTGDFDDFLSEVRQLRGTLRACLPPAPPEIVIESTEPS